MHRSAYKVNDEYYTPDWVWRQIQCFIPRDKVLWEPFPGNGQSTRCLRGMGYAVHSDDADFFECGPRREEVVVTNPPFSRIREIVDRFVEWQQPFIMVMPMSRLSVKYFQQSMNRMSEDLTIIVPSKRIDFDRPDGCYSKCPFDCGIYCYKIDVGDRSRRATIIPVDVTDDRVRDLGDS